MSMSILCAAGQYACAVDVPLCSTAVCHLPLATVGKPDELSDNAVWSHGEQTLSYCHREVPEGNEVCWYLQVVAPVRETAAQALGAAVQPLPRAHAQALLALLHQLVQQEKWDVRHGGLLGLKYLLAARPDAPQHLLAQALPPAILGLHVKLYSPLPFALRIST